MVPSPDEEEVALCGGEVTAEVVRVGDTVRRTHGAMDSRRARPSPAPRGQGLRWGAAAPGLRRPRARDPHYIEGTPGKCPWPDELRTDAGLGAVVRLLGAFHDAVADFVPPPGAEWVEGPTARGPGQIVCHRNIGPENIIWRGGEPVAIIDWDFAGRGSPRRPVLSRVPCRADAR